jgi:glycosyltransferase involved in cell wall biosynthesis
MRLTVLSIAYPLAPIGPDAAGGSEQILSQLDRRLVRDGHTSVIIACQGSRTEGRLIEMPLDADHLDDTVHAAAQERYRVAIRNAMARWNFDLIHMHSLDWHTYLPPEGPPVLVTLHLPPDWYPDEVFRLSRAQTWLQCVSASQLRRCPPSGNLLPFIENGVPLDRLSTTVGKRGFALALGRVCPEKGFHLAVEAAELADVPLIVAGEIFRYRLHEQYYEHKMLPRLDGRMRRFIGPIGMVRKRRLLAAAGCLLVPSLVPETSSLVTMEALACGTPVVAYPSGALPEIIEHGRTGFIVDNPRDMARAIHHAARLDPNICRAAARERFSADRMSGQYLSLYERLAQSGASRTAEAGARHAS